MQQKWPVLTLFLALVLTACNLPTVRTATPALPASGPAALTFDALRNATYFGPFYQRTVTLTDGSFFVNTDTDKYSVMMLDRYALGDLNGDGVDDAAVILTENGGGSGIFVSVVAMLNQDGAPVFTAAAPIEDRPDVYGISISNGGILVRLDIHGPSDPGCCPRLPTKQTYRLVSGKLVLMRFTSSPGRASEHAIDISSPADGAEVTNPFTINGNVTIAPFESTMAYRILLPDGTLVNESSLMVNAPDMGAPGTFSLTLNLSNAGITGPIRVEIFEKSAADGSLVMLAAINLVVH
jgi:hypothetical protein